MRWWGVVATALPLAACGGSGGDTGTGPDGPPTSAPVSVAIDVAAGRHPISPDVYGVTLWYEYNWVADTTARDMAFARDVRLPLNRHGGNATSRYNWLVDSSNAAADWYFMGGNGTSDPTPGHMVDSIIEKNRTNGVKTVVTVPTGPWINATSEWTCSFPVSIYGPQQDVNPWTHPDGDDCGNGLTPAGAPILDEDPGRNHVPNSPDLQRRFVRHLVETFGNAASGGVAVYELDNEPGLWMSTHRDVHPLPLGYHEQLDYTLAYARAIKSADPTAFVLGPTDIQWDDCWQCSIDGARDNGGVPLGLWYLQELAAAEQAEGVRLLDYFSEHYPGQNAADPVSRAVANVRQWRQWIDEAYPGTRIAIDEYSWADPASPREGLLVADGLGAFGREGVSLASYWPTSDWNADATSYGALAFRLFRNYDGGGSAFGETSVRASSSDETRLAVYAAQREADGALTIVAVNKSAGAVSAAFTVAGVPAGPGAVYRLSEANPGGLARAADVALTAGAFTAELPAASASLIVFH